MRTIIVTGASSGIGLAVCKELLNLDFQVIGIGRDKKKCEEVNKQLDGKCIFFQADLMQQGEVKQLAKDLSFYLEKNSNAKLYALINNAGGVRSWYSTTEDGYEQQFALNHLAGFLLTHYLFNYLKADKGRILITSSNSHKKMKVHWNDIMFKRNYNPLLVYKQSKLCNMLFAYAFNEKFAKTGVRAFGIDPGLVKTEIGLKETGGLVNFVWSLRMKRGVDPMIPAKTYTWLCTQKEQPKGLYYFDCLEKKYNKEICHKNAERLFKISEKLCGIEFGRN